MKKQALLKLRHSFVLFRAETKFRDLSSSFSVVGVVVTDWMLTHNTPHHQHRPRHGVRNEREMGVVLVSSITEDYFRNIPHLTHCIYFNYLSVIS